MTIRLQAVLKYLSLVPRALILGLAFVVSFACCPCLTAENVVVVVLDDSGSMNERMGSGKKSEPRMDVAKQALRKLVTQLPEDTRLGVLLMNGSYQSGGWLIPLGVLNRRAAISQIEKVEADGGTPLGESMKTALNALLEYRQKQPFGDYRLLVVTDGEATDEEVLQQFLPDIVSRGIFIDVIGVDMKSDHSLASRSHSYRKADDAASLEKALTEVFAESSYSDDLNGAQAEFDLIAALPDELAQQALAALTELQGQPLGAGRSQDADSDGEVGAPTGKRAEDGSWICTFTFIILLLVTVRVLVSVVARISKK